MPVDIIFLGSLTADLINFTGAEKIDFVVSLIMAVGEMMTMDDSSSVYNDRGLLIL